MESSMFWFIGGLLMLAVVNCWSTIAVARDSALSKQSKGLQILLIWVLPLLGATVVLTVRHFASRQQSRPPGDSSLVVEDRHYISKGYF
jgi:hypothetical protein